MRPGWLAPLRSLPLTPFVALAVVGWVALVLASDLLLPQRRPSGDGAAPCFAGGVADPPVPCARAIPTAAIPTPAPVPTAVPAPPAPPPGSSGAYATQIALVILAEVGVLGVVLTGAVLYLRSRELDLEARELALRECQAGREPPAPR